MAEAHQAIKVVARRTGLSTHVIATNASPVGNRFLFGGREWDSETGLYFTSSYNEGWPCRWKMSELEDSLTASAIRGKVKVVKIESTARGVGGEVPFSQPIYT